MVEYLSYIYCEGASLCRTIAKFNKEVRFEDFPPFEKLIFSIPHLGSDRDLTKLMAIVYMNSLIQYNLEYIPKNEN